MSADQKIRRMQAVFDAALEQPSASREQWVRQTMAEQPDWAEEVLRMLEFEAEGSSVLDAQGVAEDVAAALESMALDRRLIGERAGPYVLREEIGAGGMGRVFRADRDDGEVDQQVAIKIVREDALASGLLKRFSNERQALADLIHPNICRFIDAGILESGLPFVVMELVAGIPITDYCDQHALSVRQRLALFDQVVDAVSFAHSNLVLHRDIKPSNVLVTAEGRVKLIDFGIAKRLLLHSARQATMTADRYLTPASASPEQLGQGASTVASDIYSLGALLYELLCGEAPFDFNGLGFAEIERRLLNIPAKPPSIRVSRTSPDVSARRRAGLLQLMRELRGDLDSIALNCLRKEPGLRYPSCAHLKDDIQRYLSGRPISLRRGERWYVLKRFVTRHRLAVTLGAGLMVSAALFLVFVSLLSVQLREQRNIALRERDTAIAVAELLKSSFLLADPARSAGADITARKILDAAKPRLEELRAKDPVVFAALAATIAEVELGFENDSAASVLTARALEALREPADGARPLQRQLLMLQGEALTGEGRFEEAERALLGVRELDVQPRLDWRIAQGRYLYYVDRMADSIDMLQSAVAESEHLPVQNADRLEARWQLAEALRIAEQLDQAINLLRSVSSELLEQLGESDPRYLLSELRIVDVLTESDRPLEAEQVARHLLPVLTRSYGQGSTLSALTRDSLGRALYAQRKVDEAIAEYEIVLQAWRESLGGAHPRTLRAALNLAQMYSIRPARRSQAEPLYREALTGLNRLFGAESNIVLFVRVQYARFLTSDLRYDAALALMVAEEAMKGLKVAGPSNRDAYAGVLGRIKQGLSCETNAPLHGAERCKQVEDALAAVQ